MPDLFGDQLQGVSMLSQFFWPQGKLLDEHVIALLMDGDILTPAEEPIIHFRPLCRSHGDGCSMSEAYPHSVSTSMA